MAVTKSSSSSGGRRRKGLFFVGGSTPKFVTWIFRIFFCTIFVMCLFGVINQVATGQSMVDFFKEVGTDIGNTIVYIFKGEEETPVNATDQGIYVNGYEPSDSKKILDTIKDD